MASLTPADRTHVPESRIKNKNKQLLTALEEAGAKGRRVPGVGEGAGGGSRGGLARGATQVSSET